MRTVTKKEGIQQTKARLGEFVKKKLETKVMHSQYIRHVGRWLNSDKDTFLWLLTGDLKVKYSWHKITHLKQNAMKQKYYKQKQQMQTMPTVWQESRPHRSNYWQNTINKGCMMACVLNYTATYERKWVKLGNEPMYEHVSKLVDVTKVR
jgi:hypothetical protein